jgi:carboxyl-terminal processing protease
MTRKLQTWLPLLFSLTLAAGMWLGYKVRDTLPGRNFFSIDRPSPLQEMMELIKSKYVDDVKLGAIGDTAIHAMLGRLDPHSVFIPASGLQDFNDDIAGKYFGIGIEYSIIDDTINVTSTMPGGPAFKAGIKTGDKLLKAGDSTITGKKLKYNEIKKRIRGNAGTVLTITLLRQGKEIKLDIKRGVIAINSVAASYMMENGAGYIRLNKFTQSSYHDFMGALEKLKKDNLSKLILDLRGNGGGVLDEAVAVADEFLDGDKLVTYTQGKHFPRKEYRCKKPGLFEQGQLIVLADEWTASASEVVIGALQDWDRATIIGRRSFGKGLVQEQYALSDGSAVRLTIARYYTPSGRSIQRPYANGQKEYYDDVEKRFHNGEAIFADSIKNDSSKVYETSKKRKVYGGGGITPDIFVPLDTNSFSLAVEKAYSKGTITDYAYLYHLKNLSTLSSFKSPEEFSRSFVFTDNNWKEFLSHAAKDSISTNNISLPEKENFTKELKASVAKQLWGRQGYFFVINTSDKTINKALEIIKANGN